MTAPDPLPTAASTVLRPQRRVAGGRAGDEQGRERAAAAVTMRDIARVAGVSQSTVSRVINERVTAVSISEETRERVVSTAHALGYRPNPMARALRGAPSMLLGVIVRDFGDPFFASAIDVLTTESTALGYNLVLGHAHGNLAESARLATVLDTRQTDAVVLLGDLHDQPELLTELQASSVPVVATWQGVSPLDFPTVDTDDLMGIPLALSHLTDLGHSRIALASAELPMDNRLREDAYLKFMREYAMEVR